MISIYDFFALLYVVGGVSSTETRRPTSFVEYR